MRRSPWWGPVPEQGQGVAGHEGISVDPGSPKNFTPPLLELTRKPFPQTAPIVGTRIFEGPTSELGPRARKIPHNKICREWA